jgi:hypothetical protein
MQNKPLHWIGAFWLCVQTATLNAQQTTPATGGNAAGIGGSASYSVGLVVYTTNVKSSASVAQGVQQTYKISVIDATDQAKTVTLIATLFPNPTTNLITLKVDGYKLDSLNYQLYDISGVLLERQFLKNNETVIDVSKRPSSSYFLMIVEGKRVVKMFKIVKAK